MTGLNRATRRRLQKLPQINSVWEGDRRPITSGAAASAEFDTASDGECILWVDGSQGIVRAMDMVTADNGPQALVRALLRAMEQPHSPAQPARPQKIVVKDREIQFFLRGVLQELEISIEYVPDLPLIDEIFRGFQDVVSNQPPQLPPEYADALVGSAYEVWRDAPWQHLADHQIIAIELNQWDIETLYVCIMGMLGIDYGVLMYRSLDSLRRFRERVLTKNESPEQLEEAFLGQDCLFMTFESASEVEEDEDDLDLAELPLSEIEPRFGNLHPFEGMRSVLYEEEARTVFVALEALHRFFRATHRQLAGQTFPSITRQFRISLPSVAQATNNGKPLTVKVSTMPDLANELLEMAMAAEGDDEDEDDSKPLLRDDLIPENSFLSIGMIPWPTVEYLRAGADCYQSAGEVPTGGDGLPIVLIQTSRPKAKTLIEQLQNAGGLKGICFNPGEDPMEGDRYDLGILQTENGELHLFGEFIEDDPIHVAARKKWDQRCKQTKGYCGVIIAMGLTGASRGNPKLKDMLAFFEARSLTSKDLGIGTLQLIPMH